MADNSQDRESIVDTDDPAAGPVMDPNIEVPQAKRSSLDTATKFMAIGAGIGLVWGSSMRIWMRFITTSPEFSWSGTLLIVTVSCIAGALLALARHRRRVGGIGWWRMVVLSLLLLGGAGVVMWPTVIIGGIAIGWARNRGLRIALLAAAAGLQVPVVQDVILTNPSLNGIETAAAILWYLPMIGLETWGYSVCFAPRSELALRPGPTLRVAFSVAVAVLSGLSVVALGLFGT